MQRSQTLPIAPGCVVFTLDGKSLGEILEVREGCFKLDVPFKPDYWLSCTEVWSADEGGVHVNFPRSELHSHRVEAPPGG